MAQDRDFIRIKNISLIIFFILAILSVIIYFLLPSDISLAVIISALLAFLVFVATLLYYRWVYSKSIQSAAKSILISFAIKVIFLGVCFYLISRLGIVNGMIFAVSFVVFFTIFLNIEIFMIYKKLLFK